VSVSNPGVYVLSGGTQGLGETIARQLIDGGATGLVLAGRSVARGERLAAEFAALGTPTIFVPVDVSAADSADVVIGAADARFGRIDGLVNVAAATDRANVWNADIEHWDNMMAINVRSPFFMLQGAAKVMRREGIRGSIVSIGSTSGHGGQPMLLPYCVSKGALSVMTRNAAYSLMRHGIRVNQVNPGWMDTESEDATQRTWHGATDGWQEAAGKRLPTGKLVQAPDVARLVVFLLSTDSGIQTGTVIDYDQSVQGCGDAPAPSEEETPQ
jgi:NAD(P)-dependent dehydrogenase (short-subunit alcohol dehydrogenase family)